MTQKKLLIAETGKLHCRVNGCNKLSFYLTFNGYIICLKQNGGPVIKTGLFLSDEMFSLRGQEFLFFERRLMFWQMAS
jgi:hypothetical protein